VFVLAALAAAALVTADPAGAKDPTGKWVLVIDPAHGGKDDGVQLARKVVEKDVTLAIATLVKRNLEDAKNVTVRFTRMGDADVAMTDRVGSAIKAQADLFISINVTAGFEKEVGLRAVFPWFRGGQGGPPTKGATRASRRPRPDMVRTKHLNEVVRFSQILQKKLNPVFPRWTGGFAGRRSHPAEITVPAVVLESGFRPPPATARISRGVHPGAFAKAIADSVREFFQ
jgi:N-acetylmuramoyl-L-alanine amidase